MAKPIIGVDCDDVLVSNFETLIGWYNAEYGTNLQLADNNSHDLRVWGAETEEQAIRQVQRFLFSDDFNAMRPIDGALPALAELSKDYALHLFTARDHIIEAATLVWLEEHFPNIFLSTHFTAQYSLEGKRRDKVDVLVAEGVDYLIDGTLENASKAAARGIDTVLFGSYDWNQAETLPRRVTRCPDWSAVLEYFDGRR